MKKIKIILSVLTITIVSIWSQSCNKDNESIKTLPLIDYNSFGAYHNQILDKYLAEEIDTINYGDSTELVNSDTSIYGKLCEISNSKDDISTAHKIINQLYFEGEISQNEFNYFKQIVDIYEKNAFDFYNTEQKLSTLKKEVLGNENLNNNEKNNLIGVLSISISSIGYWNNKMANKKSVSNVPWYARDASGAFFGVSSGAVGYGSLFGPWGGAAVLVGCAAISSTL